MRISCDVKRVSLSTFISGMALLLSLNAHALELTFSASEYPPFRGNNLPKQGMLADITVQALSLKGHNVTIKFAPWARALHWAKHGTTDGILGLWHTKTRAHYFLFSHPLPANHMLFYKRKSDTINYSSYADLVDQKRRFGGVIGYVYPFGLIESGIITTQVSSELQTFRLLSEKRVDLIAVDRDFAVYTLNQPAYSRYKHNIEPLLPILESQKQYLAISKKINNGQQILDDFNDGLKQLIRSGKLDAIIKQHLVTP